MVTATAKATDTVTNTTKSLFPFQRLQKNAVASAAFFFGITASDGLGKFADGVFQCFPHQRHGFFRQSGL